MLFDRVVFTLNVPADAKVTVNDRPTTSTGEFRKFESTGVQLGAAYGYRVRVEFVRDGRPITEEKEISLMAGQSGALTFTGASAAQTAAATTTPAPR